MPKKYQNKKKQKIYKKAFIIKKSHKS